MTEDSASSEDLVGQKGAEPVCRSCGSAKVMRDAWAEWNPVKGLWELGQVFDGGYCADCEQPSNWFDWRKCQIDRQETIRQLNDALRTGQSTDGTMVITSGIEALGPDFVREVSAAVARFDAFTPDNDPHGEHDFGALEVQGERVFFKLDYYDLAMQAHSPDPADPKVTRRVLTIMLASEY